VKCFIVNIIHTYTLINNTYSYKTNSYLGGNLDCDSNKRLNDCETAAQTNPNNYKTYKTICSNNNIPFPSYSNGLCNGNCAAGWSDCDSNKQGNGCETDTNDDPLNYNI